MRISGVEPVNVREDHVEVSRDEPRYDGAEHVVVAEGELGHGDGVVLVHDRHGPKLDEAHEGVPRVEIRLAVHHVPAGEQDLATRNAPLGKYVRVGLRKLSLASRGAGLKRHDVGRPRGKAQLFTACRSGTRGDENHVRPLMRKLNDLIAEGADEAAVEGAVLVHEGGGADLGHHEPGEIAHQSSPPSSRTSGSSSASSAKSSSAGSPS